MSEYLDFIDVPNHSGKTRKVNVVSKKHGFSLGLIQFYGRWRQFVFIPASETVFNKDCLRDIAVFLDVMMADRKVEPMLMHSGTGTTWKRPPPKRKLKSFSQVVAEASASSGRLVMAGNDCRQSGMDDP